MNKKIACGLALALVVLAPTMAAGPAFGTQVNKGDFDFKPVIKKGPGTDDNHALDILRVSLGDSPVTDDAFIIDMESSAGSTVDFEDLLLTPWNGKMPGYEIQDTDTVLKTSPVSAETVTVVYADINNDGKYKGGDWVYIVSGTVAGGLMPTTSTASYTIRVTETPYGPAGSFVFAGDRDFAMYQSAAKVLGVDMNTDTAGTDTRAYTVAFQGGDPFMLFVKDAGAAYVPGTDGAAGGLAPRYAINLGEGTFGSQLNKGDAAFVPVVKKGPGTDDNHALDILRVSLGDSPVTDDAFIIDMESSAGSTVDFEDLLLTPWNGKMPGYEIQDTDTVLKTSPVSAETVTVVYADINNDGKYKGGDWVYIVSGTVAGGLMPTTSTASYTIRLTGNPNGPAGSFVFAGDSDFVAYQTAAKVLGDDKTDASGAATEKRAYTVAFQGGDPFMLFVKDAAAAYVPATDGPAAGGLAPRHAIRLGEDGFGAQVGKSDPEFVPVSKKGPGTDDNHALDVLRISMGDAPVTDDVFVLDMESSGASTVDFEDLLLTPWNGKMPGYEIQDDDVALKSNPVSAETVTVVYADTNNDGKYKSGDWVFIVSGSVAGGLMPTTSTASYTIRVTETPYGPAGSFVFAGDRDFAMYQSAAKVLGVDMNTDTAGTDTRAYTVAYEGAEAYLMFVKDAGAAYVPGTDGPAAGAMAPRYAIRLGGDLPDDAPAPEAAETQPEAPLAPQPNGTAPADPEPVVSATPAVQPASHDPAPAKTFGAASVDQPTADSPAFGLVALVAALAAALIVRRR